MSLVDQHHGSVPFKMAACLVGEIFGSEVITTSGALTSLIRLFSHLSKKVFKYSFTKSF